MELFKKRQKVGETIIVGELSVDDNTTIQNMVCKCGWKVLKKPGARIEHAPFGRFYSQYSYQCLNCGWESATFKTRTT